MITALLILALVLTLLIAVSLPFGGYGAGIDAAGRGMAIFLPAIFMLARAICVCAAVVLMAVQGGLSWTGLGPYAAALTGLVLAGGTGGMSFLAATQLTTNSGMEGRAAYAFLATVATPVLMCLWISAETFGVEQPQRGITFALLLVSMAAAAVFTDRDRRREAEARAVSKAAEDREVDDARIIANSLPPDATLLELLKQYDRVPETAWRARDMIQTRISARPALRPEIETLLDGADWTARILAANYLLKMSTEASPAYFKLVRPTLDEIVRRLENNVAGHDVLAPEARAAIALAWPSIHNDGLPKALMERLYASIEEHAGDSRFAALMHDARLLADLVTG